MSPRVIDRIAQAGKTAAPDRQLDVLVIGGGPAGANAAIEAARGGAAVLLVDENPVEPGLMGLDTPLFFGGRYTNTVHAPDRLTAQVFAANPLLEEAMEAGAEIELGLACWGAFTPGYGLKSLPGAIAGLADARMTTMVGFERIIIATGARDVAFSFPGWDRPGVMGARALASLLHTYDAFAGRRLAILGSGELGLRTALLAISRGLEVAAIIEVEDAVQGPAALAAEVAAHGVPILTGHVPAQTQGGIDGVEALEVRSLAGGEAVTLACDTIVQAVSLTPVIELLDVLGADLVMRERLGGYAPASPDSVGTSLAQVFVAGEAAGVPGGASLSLDAACESGRRAGLAALASLGRGSIPGPREGLGSGFDAVAYQQAWMRALLAANPASTVICQCEEVSREALLSVRPPTYLGPPSPAQARRDLDRLLEDGPPNQDQIKRLTRACMGPCQAHRCREQVALALACASNEPAARIPLAGYRAPVRPLPLSILAAWDETAAMSRHWDVWMGIPGQWTPYDDIGTEREALSAGILGGEG
ncbi:MAG TPA: FAD-dependent oxidoreductase [Caulobacteraceae bacterium]